MNFTDSACSVKKDPFCIFLFLVAKFEKRTQKRAAGQKLGNSAKAVIQTCYLEYKTMMIPDDPFAAVISIVTVFLCMIWAYYTGKHNQVHPSSPRRRMEKIDSGSLLDFFFIIGHLKTNKRTGWELRKIPQVESVADHMYRMSVMSLVLSSLCNSDDDTGETLDANRCVKIALVHDLAEAIVGDIVPFELSGITKEDKHKMERDAMEKMAATLKNTAVAKVHRCACILSVVHTLVYVYSCTKTGVHMHTNINTNTNTNINININIKEHSYRCTPACLRAHAYIDKLKHKHKYKRTHL